MKTKVNSLSLCFQFLIKSLAVGTIRHKALNTPAKNNKGMVFLKLFICFFVAFSSVNCQENNETGQNSAKEYEAWPFSETLEDALCNYLNKNCPFLKSRNGIPTSDMNSSSPQVDVNVTMDMVNFVEFNEAHQEFSVVADIYTTWRLPPCSTWDGLSTMNSNDSLVEMAIQRVSLCNILKTDVYHPLLLHSNSVNNIYQLEEYVFFFIPFCYCFVFNLILTSPSNGSDYVRLLSNGTMEMVNKNLLISSCTMT